jgi:hypothetical protein
MDSFGQHAPSQLLHDPLWAAVSQKANDRVRCLTCVRCTPSQRTPNRAHALHSERRTPNHARPQTKPLTYVRYTMHAGQTTYAQTVHVNLTTHVLQPPVLQPACRCWTSCFLGSDRTRPMGRRRCLWVTSKLSWPRWAAPCRPCSSARCLATDRPLWPSVIYFAFPCFYVALADRTDDNRGQRTPPCWRVSDVFLTCF